MTCLVRYQYVPLVTAVLSWFYVVGFCDVGFAREASRVHSKSAQGLQSPAAKPNAPLSIAARLSVKPKSHRGPCPAVFVFSGEIKSNRSGTLVYRFVRSDGSRSNSSTLSFFEPGAQRVGDTWKLDDSSNPSCEGWESLEVVSPIRVESNKASFRMECRQDGSASRRGGSR